MKKAADLTKPIDKRIYKGTCPTCHDFGPVTDQADIIPLLVGFSGGQIQLIDPIRKELSKLYNEEVSQLKKAFYYPGNHSNPAHERAKILTFFTFL